MLLPLREERNEAVSFAQQNGATEGQVAAVKKALTSAGYYVTGPHRPS